MTGQSSALIYGWEDIISDPLKVMQRGGRVSLESKISRRIAGWKDKTQQIILTLSPYPENSLKNPEILASIVKPFTLKDLK